MSDVPVTVVALCKDEERYVFIFYNESRTETLQQVAKMAFEPSLSFSWYDAAIIGEKIRKQEETKGD